MMEANRINSLDYLRGIMACAVMFYHYSTWTFDDFNASTILGRIGIYGVSFFYILSGLTLSIVYKSYPVSFQSVALFFTKRVFRIYPLLFLTTVTWAFALKITDVRLIILNLSGIFGFVQPDAYIGTGVWSIGNELVFYSIFPLLFFLERRSIFGFYALVLLMFLIASYFAFFSFNPQVSLSDQWSDYVNPLNQAFLFCGGVLIGHVTHTWRMNWNTKYIRLMVIASVALFCFFPAAGDAISIVSGWNKFIFSGLCFFACLLIYIDRLNFSMLAHKPLSFLGETSYSIYLLHPLTYQACKALSKSLLNLNALSLMIMSIGATFVASYLSYKLVERPAIRLGKRVCVKLTQTL